jgi:iron-sulfur cluster assembly accessory protein
MLEQITTQTQINTQGISLSSAASQAVQDILTEKKLEGYALRIYVSGGGCCGTQFGMALDDNIREIDTTFESDGVQVVIDDVSIEYLRGASVDFINDPQHGAGFIVDSPNVKAHDHSHSEGACACGGSCDCNN